MDLDDEERARLARALAPTRGRRSGIASVMVEREGVVLDAAVDLETGRTWRRPLPETRADALARWIELLARQRGQLAHELSGPATGVLAAVETVLEYEPIPASTREVLVEARTGLMRLARLLAERDPLLEADRAPSHAPLEKLLQGWADDSLARLDPLGERMHVEVQAPATPVRVPSAILGSAVGVFLSNAWRSRRGRDALVRLRGAVDGSVVWVEAVDEGSGISAEARPRAGDLGFSARVNGVGLGLFSVRWALRGRGGTLLDRDEEGRTAASLFCALLG